MNDSNAVDEAAIRALIDDRVKAVRCKDVHAAIKDMAPHIVSFDVVNPLQRIGSNENERRADEWFSSFQDWIGFEIRDLNIAASNDVAFSHALHRYSGTKADGQEIAMWVRATMCYRKINDTWMITHEHQSVPFDPQTGAASLDLQPSEEPLPM